MDITLEKVKEIIGGLYVENYLLTLELAQHKERQNAQNVPDMATKVEARNPDSRSRKTPATS